MSTVAKFFIGQIIQHNKFGYRGVIFDVDSIFSLSDDWYDQVTQSHPPKDQPWYHVLVDNNYRTTYVAERNLANALDASDISHPDLGLYFERYEAGAYRLKHRPLQ